MTIKFSYLLFFLSTQIFAQVSGKVINEETKEPISYVNIWVQGMDKGTTSAENGDFVLDVNSHNQSLVFSAIGFETKTIEASEQIKSVGLKPKFTELNEVIVSAPKRAKETVVGIFKRGKISRFFGSFNQPKIWARYFPHEPEYKETPFLKSIKVFTISNNSDSRFNIRFYSVKDDGSPGESLYAENVIGSAKKGNKMTEVNIADLNITVPEKGLFVAFEWFIIEKNKYEYTYKEKGKKFKDFGYNPSLGTISVKTDANGWMFFQGKWQKVEKNFFSEDKGKGKEIYSLLAIELALSN